ncbi:MAG: MTH938/NDUFAF3 family protein [Candidatus Korarchaeum sp.]
MPRVDGTGFGYIVVDGERYDEDIVVTDKVFRRRKELSSELRKEYGHTPLTGEELLHYFSQDPPEVVVVGTGQSGMLPLVGVEGACELLGAELICERTREAVETFNKLSSEGRKVGAVFHVTC